VVCRFVHVSAKCKNEGLAIVKCPNYSNTVTSKKWLDYDSDQNILYASSPINVNRLRFELLDYPDINFAHYLCSSVEIGFDTLVHDNEHLLVK